MVGETFHSEAYRHVKSQQEGIWSAIDALNAKDPAAIYADEFVHACSLLGEFDLAKVIAKLRVKYKGVSLRDWKRGVIGRRPIGVEVRVDDSWKNELIPNSKGAPQPVLANAITALRLAPEWKGVFAYNELTKTSVAVAPPPFDAPKGPWMDASDILATNWMHHNGIMVGRGVVADAIHAVSHDNPFHPVRQYLRALKWDGEPRIDRWLTEYMGVEWTEFTGSAGAKWLISAVARAMNPGCQVDTCLVLEGEQGIYKSSALRALASDEWFTDQIADPTDIKESSQDLAGKWIVEISELDKYSKHEQGVIKSFIPRRTDHYRPSYGRHSSDFDRQCVFAATTNKSEYLADETGGRRWWPVTCKDVDLARVQADRDQLWAEAVARYDEGAKWHIDDSPALTLARSEQMERFIDDAWFAPISAFIETLAAQRPEGPGYQPDSVSIEEVLLRLGIPVHQFDDQKTKRVAKCLRILGWEQYRESAAPRPRRYKKPTPTDASDN